MILDGVRPVERQLELLGEIFAGPVVNGSGNVLAGASFVFRYNFVQSEAVSSPTCKCHRSCAFTLTFQRRNRGDSLGLPVEFNLQGVAVDPADVELNIGLW